DDRCLERVLGLGIFGVAEPILSPRGEQALDLDDRRMVRLRSDVSPLEGTQRTLGDQPDPVELRREPAIREVLVVYAVVVAHRGLVSVAFDLGGGSSAGGGESSGLSSPSP